MRGRAYKRGRRKGPVGGRRRPGEGVEKRATWASNPSCVGLPLMLPSFLSMAHVTVTSSGESTTVAVFSLTLSLVALGQFLLLLFPSILN